MCKVINVKYILLVTTVTAQNQPTLQVARTIVL
jgi:hypothetical protein